MKPSNIDLENDLDQVKAKYQVLISKPLQALCLKSDAIARQFSASSQELNASANEQTDPIGDATHTPVKGIVHRYPNRVLLTPSVNCPSYCRFCFRKARVGQEKELTNSEISAALEYIKSYQKIEEVILSGGDPLALSSEILNRIFEVLDKVEHIKTIRIHTRIQLTGNGSALTNLKKINWPKKPLFIVVHCNHPDEIDSRFQNFIEEFKAANAVILSQSVLLKGINDTEEVLKQLFTKLTQHRVIPYYLHHPDLVQGAGHFRVSLKKGMRIMAALQGDLSGYALPKYILDLPGGLGKVPINSSWLKETVDSVYEITSPFGKKVIYSDI